MRRLTLLPIAVLAAVGVVAAATQAQAVPITVPTSLSPGSQYRLAFVTSTTRDATSSNIADYNVFVTGVANSVPQLLALGTTWTAIASTSSVAARDNTSTNPGVDGAGVEIFLLDDTQFASSNIDLWDGSNIPNPLRIDEDGTIISTGNAWTGTSINGTPSNPLGTATSARAGRIAAISNQWVSFLTFPPSQSHHMYAISGTLTVIPEPSTALLLAAGLTALAVRRRSARVAPD